MKETFYKDRVYHKLCCLKDELYALGFVLLLIHSLHEVYLWIIEKNPFLSQDNESKADDEAINSCLTSSLLLKRMCAILC